MLVAQDLASYGRDVARGGTLVTTDPSRERSQPIVDLVRAVSDRVDVDPPAVPVPERPDRRADRHDPAPPACRTSTCRCSTSASRCCGGCAGGATASGSCGASRRSGAASRGAAFRSNFIVGYPGETEADHDQLLAFVEEAELDWCGFFAYSAEDGTHAAKLDGQVDPALMHERLAELRELQDAITARRRDALIGSTLRVLVDEPGVARSVREAPEIDGIVEVPDDLWRSASSPTWRSSMPSAQTSSPRGALVAGSD